MRSFVSALALLVIAAGLVVAAGEKKFGKELTLKETTKISAIFAHPDDFKDKRVQVEGTIVDVCKKRGCWIKIASDKEHQSLVFKVEDGVMVFPVEVKGKTAKAEGTVSVRPLTKEECEAKEKEHAEKGEKGCADGGGDDCCKSAIMLRGEGAVVSDTPVTR